MIDMNELRRLAQEATPGPWKLLPVGDKSKCFAVADINFLSVLTVVDECGTSFGAVYLDGDAKFIAAANPAAIAELLDRLEAAESECFEQARLNGIGAEKELALLAKLESTEKERDELRAKVEVMEKQEPVAYLYEYVSPMDGKTPVWRAGLGEWNGQQAKSAKPLYALPGTKGETE